MEISINKPAESVCYPDIDDNLSLPEEKRFGFRLRKPSAIRLAQQVRRTRVVNGETIVEQDWTGSIRAYVVEILNPPTLKLGDEESRDLVLSDVFEYSELNPIIGQLSDAINKLREGEGDDSPKN
jgi:hypothetical protein